MASSDDYGDDTKYVPSDMMRFMKALQDPGKVNNKDKVKLIQYIQYKELERYCGTIVKLWKDKKFPCMPQNVTQAKNAIAGLIVKKRNLVDAISVEENFRGSPHISEL